jgi:hypothetical protein
MIAQGVFGPTACPYCWGARDGVILMAIAVIAVAVIWEVWN